MLFYQQLHKRALLLKIVPFLLLSVIAAGLRGKPKFWFGIFFRIMYVCSRTDEPKKIEMRIVMRRNIQNRLPVLAVTVILILLADLPAAFSQDTAVETYSKVRVMVTAPNDLLLLEQNGVSVEGFRGNLKTGIELVLNEYELANLQQCGLPYEVLIPDMNEFYRNRRPATEVELERGRQIGRQDNVSGFEYGSMGGFYTYAEVAAELDSMTLLYPNIITAKTSIGMTEQGRDIWMVKISDNPGLDESNTEPAIYYDAVHHAREPAAMAVTIYYMYWLLENYGLNPEATYLVDNREMFFVPIVNPDGYVYNQTTNPNGGGMWRKNRRDNANSSCYGIDLNRNYSYGWGDPGGSSGDPCSETYRGETPFSEPETQAVRDLALAVHPAIAFSIHSVAGRYLNPYGYNNVSPDFDVYSEFASDFAAANQYLYGRTSEMLGYFSSGTTRDYLHSEGAYAWTPEIGGSGFWPSQSEIFPLVSENLYPMKYLSWVGGAFADFQNYAILGSGNAAPGDTLKVGISVKNRGLKLPAKQVVVNIATEYPHLIPLVNAVDYDSIASRQIENNFSQPFEFLLSPSAAFLDEIHLIVSITQEGVQTALDTLTIVVGKANVLFSDNAENGKVNWNSSGSGQPWDTTYVDFYSESHSFADSRYGNSGNNVSTYLTMNQNVDLAGALYPRVEFWAKWATEAGYDYVRFQISVNNGASWTSLAGKYTQVFSGQPSYLGIKHWVKEEIDLSQYIGQQVRFRFYIDTDGGLSGDGFYFDDFKVVNYEEILVALPGEQNALPKKLALAQNYPNPFNPSTTIRYDIPASLTGLKVVLRVYNNLGQEVRTLVNAVQSPGSKSIAWDGKNDSGQAVSSGVYIYRLRVGYQSLTRKMLFLK